MQDFDRSIILVLDSNIEDWQKVNTASHISAYFGKYLADHRDRSYGSITNFITSNNVNIKPNTQYPIVIKQASKISKLNNLYNATKENPEVEQFTFIKEMIETNSDNQISQRLKDKQFETVDILGIGLFGKSDVLHKLTKKFSLYS